MEMQRAEKLNLLRFLTLIEVFIHMSLYPIAAYIIRKRTYVVLCKSILHIANEFKDLHK